MLTFLFAFTNKIYSFSSFRRFLRVLVSFPFIAVFQKPGASKPPTAIAISGLKEIQLHIKYDILSFCQLTNSFKQYQLHTRNGHLPDQRRLWQAALVIHLCIRISRQLVKEK
jgi:hypothetical protein